MSTTTIARHTRQFQPRRRNGRTLARTRSRSTGLVLLEVALLVAIIVLLIAGVVMTSGRVHAQAPMSPVFVESGQTLWSIAAQHPVLGQTTEQTADMISEINGVRGGRVIAGDTIVVPARQPDQTLTASR